MKAIFTFPFILVAGFCCAIVVTAVFYLKALHELLKLLREGLRSDG